MILAKRFTVNGAVISIFESDGAYTIEIAGCGKNAKKHEAVRKYLCEEGILDAVFKGRKGLQFDTVDVESLMEKK